MLFPTPKSQRQLFGIEFLGPSEEFNAEKAKFNAERVFPTPKGYFQCRKVQRRRAAMDAWGVRACVRACVHACVRVCVCVHVCVCVGV